MPEKKHNTAVIAAAGIGKRMHAGMPKQLLKLAGLPILYYPLMALQKFDDIQDIIIVTGEDLIPYIQKELVDAFGFTKVTRIIKGGRERFDSVYAGLKACISTDYVFIQDAVRPFQDAGILYKGYECALKYGTGVAAVPSKDTMKLVGKGGVVERTPNRRDVWMVQTPQIFRWEKILAAYEKFFADPDPEMRRQITDDAMVMEIYGEDKVHLFKASYRNLKITTPEDLQIAEEWMKEKSNGSNPAE